MTEKLFSIEGLERFSKYADDETLIVNGKFIRDVLEMLHENERLCAAIEDANRMQRFWMSNDRKDGGE